jgi:predicted Zn-dependent peptidase
MSELPDRMVTLLIGLSLWFPPCVQAQMGDTSARPIVGPISVPTLAVPNRLSFENGARLIAVPFGHSPRSLVRVAIETGPDGPTTCGLAQVLVALFQKGSATVGAKQYADSIAHMGGTFTVALGPERIELSAEVLEPFVPAALQLLVEIVSNPHPDAPTVQESIHDVEETRARARPSLDATASGVLESMLFPGGEFRGSCSDGGSPRETAVATVQRYYADRVSPAHTTVLVVGRYETTELRRAATASLGAWYSGTGAPREAPAPSRSSSGLTIFHRPGAKQAAIVVGARAPSAGSPDFESFSVVNALLGGSLISRITTNIREAKGYAYAPSSVVTVAPSGEAYWAESADVAANVAWPALREILSEINRLSSEAPTEAEVEGVERYVAGRTLLSRASRSGLMDEVVFDEEVARNQGDHGRPKIESRDVTPSEVQRLTAAYFSPRKLAVVVVADTIALAEQIGAMRSAVGGGAQVSPGQNR